MFALGQSTVGSEFSMASESVAPGPLCSGVTILDKCLELQACELGDQQKPPDKPDTSNMLFSLNDEDSATKQVG